MASIPLHRHVMALIFDEHMHRLALMNTSHGGGLGETYRGILGTVGIGESGEEVVMRRTREATRLHVPLGQWTMLGSVGSNRFPGAFHRVDVFYTRVKQAALWELARIEGVSVHDTADYRVPNHKNMPLASVIRAAVVSQAALAS